MNFEETIETLAAQRAKTDPLLAAKQQLQPTKRDALAAIEEFDKVAKRIAPMVEVALDKYNRACGIGLNYSELHRQIQQAYALLSGSRAGFADIVNAVDRLDAYAVGQGWHRYFPATLMQRRANIGALAEFERKLAWHVSVLEGLLRDRASGATPATPPPFTLPTLPEPMAPVTVQATFDPRR